MHKPNQFGMHVAENKKYILALQYNIVKLLNVDGWATCATIISQVHFHELALA